MRIHIGFITSEYPHPKVAQAAGIGTSTANLASALIKSGESVSVFVYGLNADEVIMDSGVKIHLIKTRKYKWFNFYKHRKFLARYINQAVKTDKIDILEAPDWTGITAFMKFDVPLVIRFHGSDAYFCRLENRKQKFKNFMFEKWAVKNATAYIAPTAFAGQLSSQIFSIDPAKVQTIHYGLSLTQFDNPTPESYVKGQILYVGTIIRKKGVLELPAILRHVIAEYPDVQLVLAGADASDITTRCESTWELLRQEFGPEIMPHVNYLGKLPYSEVKRLIMHANLCVFPTFAETLGMVTIESMAMQKAVVNSGFGWATELIDDGKSGFLCNPANHTEFAQKIVRLLRDDDLRIAIGTNARRTVELKFDIERIVLQNISFYKSVLER